MQAGARLIRRPIANTRVFIACRGFADGESGKKEGSFFGSFFDRKVEEQHISHSTKLAPHSHRTIVLQTHNVKTDCQDKYIKLHKTLVDHVAANRNTLECESIGNFGMIVGDEDQFIHLWSYEDGYKGIDRTLKAIDKDTDLLAIRKELIPLLRDRHNQYLMPFSFWPETYKRKEKHVYELRSYHLKPGTMMEWANYWARAIGLRDSPSDDPEGFIGMFSQAGELYNVKHIWCYENLEERREARDVVWEQKQEEWSEIVSHTVPLVRHMTARIMRPLPYSPTQ